MTLKELKQMKSRLETSWLRLNKERTILEANVGNDYAINFIDTALENVKMVIHEIDNDIG